MHLPAAIRRRIVYATAATLLVGGLAFAMLPGSTPKPNPTEQSPSEQSTSEQKPAESTALTAAPEAQVAQLTANDPQAPLAGKAEVGAVAKTEETPRPKVSTYTVVEGDTVGAIAEKHGLKSETILWSNQLSEDDFLQIGQELKIPAVDGAIHMVESGDTLWEIASDYGIDPEKLAEANPDVDAAALQPDQVLIVPGGEPIMRRLSTMVASRSGSSRETAPSGSFGRWPVSGPITDSFGWRTHPVYGNSHYHDGTDIGVEIGTPVVSVARGRVTYVGYLGGYGLTIKVDHGNGVVTMYAHMSEATVEAGQTVGSGEQVGLSGNTGTSTGPHLHFTVFVDGSPVDPIGWLP